MKRHTLARTGIAAGVLAAAMTVNAFGAQITEEKAKSIALTHAGQKEEDVTILQIESDVEHSRVVYEVKFLTQDYREYDYEILAADGTIMSIDFEAVTVVSDSQNPISLDQAKELSLKHAGQKAEDSTFLKAEAEIDDGLLIYETEFYTSDSKKYKYELDGATGTVISWEYDAWGCLLEEENARASKQADAISGPESARAAALKKAGLKASDVTWGKIERDHDDGQLIYKGKFFYGTLEYEFEIDGATGVFLDWDIDTID